MEKFKTLVTSRVTVFIGCAVLAILLAWPFVGSAQDKSGKAKDPDPHAQHKDKQTPGDQNLASQIAELGAKVKLLEAALKQDHKGTPSGTPDKGGQADKTGKAEGVPPGERISAKFQNCAQCHQTRPSGALPPDHLEKVGGSDKGATQDDKTGTGDKGIGMKDGEEMLKMMEMMQAKMKKMMGGKGMGMMDEKKKAGMGMMEEKKKAGMGMMEQKKAAGMGMGKMKGMGGDKAEIGGSTTGTTEQHMTQLMQLMQQMMEMRMMEMKMKLMDKGIETGAAPDPHHDHSGTPPEKGGKADVLEKIPDPSADAGKDLPAQVRELQARIANLEAALKKRP